MPQPFLFASLAGSGCLYSVLLLPYCQDLLPGQEGRGFGSPEAGWSPKSVYPKETLSHTEHAHPSFTTVPFPQTTSACKKAAEGDVSHNKLHS